MSFAYDFDFESGSVGAWSSYPPAQDTAYDPTIEVKKIGGHSGLALVREIRPNYPIDYVFGVRRKLHILIDRQSRLRFKYFAKNHGKTDAIVVKLALGGGLAKEVRIPAGENLAWHEADISLAAFASPDAPTQLDAVAILAACPQADPEATLGFAIDDVCVAGWRAKAVSISEPRAHWLEELSAFVAGRHFEEGEPIDFHVELPAENAGGFVRVAEVLPTGKPIDLRLAKLGKMFAARLPREHAKAGLWRADFLQGPDAADNGATTLYFLVRAKGAPASHPRLF